MAVIEISNSLFFTNIQNIINSGNSVELKVKGTSMHPTLLNGKHKVVLIPYQKQNLRVGTIALFVYRGKYILHRLISKKGDCLMFQGDNLPYIRECINDKDIIGVVEFIITPTGKIIDCKKQWFFIKNKLYRLVCQYCLIFIKRLFYRITVFRS